MGKWGFRKLKKTIKVIATVGVVCLGSAFLNESVHAETLDNLQQTKMERSTIQANLSEAEQKIADVMVELKDLNKEIDQVNYALEKNKEKMTEAKDKITNTKKEVAEIEDGIKELEKNIEIRYEILKKRIKSYQSSGGDIHFLQVIFGSESFSDLISRTSAVSKIAEADKKLMEQQKEDKAELEKKQDTIEEKLDNLTDMKSELEAMQVTIMKQKEQNKADKKRLKEKRQNLNKLKSNLESKDSSLAAIEHQIHAQETSSKNGQSESGSVSSNSNAEDGNLKQLSRSVSNGSSGSISTAINAGFAQLGTPYVWNGESPAGFDCSGFISWAYGKAGVSVPSSTSALQHTGTKVSASNMQRGDLVFFNTYKQNGHVGIYLGNGKFIGAQDSGLGVADMSSTYWSNAFTGYVRRVQ